MQTLLVADQNLPLFVALKPNDFCTEKNQSHRQTRSFAGANSFLGPGGGSKRALALVSRAKVMDI